MNRFIIIAIVIILLMLYGLIRTLYYGRAGQPVERKIKK
jgi:hypothetical protein